MKKLAVVFSYKKKTIVCEQTTNLLKVEQKLCLHAKTEQLL